MPYFFVSVYRAGNWLLGPDRAAVYTDFACGRIAAVQPLIVSCGALQES